jgi:hypothetical protein
MRVKGMGDGKTHLVVSSAFRSVWTENSEGDILSMHETEKLLLSDKNGLVRGASCLCLSIVAGAALGPARLPFPL